MKAEFLNCGGMKFYGVENIRTVLELILEDDSFTYALAPWPHATMVVRAHDNDSRLALLDLLEG